jgi:hypothetical protein
MHREITIYLAASLDLEIFCGLYPAMVSGLRVTQVRVQVIGINGS